ncbi:MAG: sugar phosphate isomerase/epimerase [Planctomycetes bacterium]|nr:sugar phosphate isomerase/epimerase [Planctomycetota bacterium]
MQIGISHLVVPDLSMSEFFAQSAAAGYEVVELCMKDSGELTLASDDDSLARIVDQADDAGVKLVSMVHLQCTGNMLDSGEAQQKSIDETAIGLAAAAKMGIGCTLHTLGAQRPDLFYDDAYQNAIDSLKKLAPIAEQLGVTLAIELVWNGFLFSPIEMRNMLDQVGSDRVGFYFDPGNMAVFQYPHHWVRILGQHVKMVHMKDWKGNALNGSWPALLAGDVDYAAVNVELRAIGYDGPMISEVPPSDAPLAETAESIRRIIAM